MPPSFEEYVHARSGYLLRVAYLLCGDRHLAEDLVQEVLARAHRRWSNITAEQPDGYLRSALVRAHLSWRRRRSNTERAVDWLPEQSVADDFTHTHAQRAQLWQLLHTLPRTQRTVLVLRYFEDLDDDRIAEILHCARGTVRVHASRGLAALRGRIETVNPVGESR